MIRAYLEFAKKSFKNNIVYRMDYFVGVINTLVMIVVNIAIWKAIYEEEEVLGGIQFRLLITYIALAYIMQCVYVMEEYFIETKVRSGLISSDLLKPISFRLYIFSYNVGTLLFRVVMQLLPVILIAAVLFKILPPFSLKMAAYFIASMILGYLVLFSINFIAWMGSFWFYWNFSLITIKDAAIMILSGALLPLWFMPQKLIQFIKFTPFDSIYFIPISIYLGQIPEEEILLAVMRQVIWIAILTGLGHLLWKAASKKLVIQGG